MHTNAPVLVTRFQQFDTRACLTAPAWIFWTLVLSIIICAASADASTKFQPRGCEFSVEFPGKPKISELYAPELGKYETAQYEGGNGGINDAYMCYAEGVVLAPALNVVAHADPEVFLRNMTKTYADAIGLANVTYEFDDSGVAPRMTIKGYKIVGGTRAMYSDLVMLGNGSFIRLGVGCAAHVFPQRAMSAFLESVRMVPGSSAATPSKAQPSAPLGVFSPTTGTISLFEYAQTALGSSRSIDPASVRMTGPLVQFDRYFTLKPEGGTVVVAQVQMDCQKRATRIVRINQFDENGTKKFSQDFADEMATPAPGADELEILDCMCAGNTARAAAEARLQLARAFKRITHTYGR